MSELCGWTWNHVVSVSSAWQRRRALYCSSSSIVFKNNGFPGNNFVENNVFREGEHDFMIFNELLQWFLGSDTLGKAK